MHERYGTLDAPVKDAFQSPIRVVAQDAMKDKSAKPAIKKNKTKNTCVIKNIKKKKGCDGERHGRNRPRAA